MYTLKTYTPKIPKVWDCYGRNNPDHYTQWEELRKADTITGPGFYIQLKGEHSGRPMKTPIKNCTQVITKDPHLFQLCSMLWRGGLFRRYLHGSCQQFITHRVIKDVLAFGYALDPSNIKAGADLLQVTDNAIKSHQATIQKLQELQKSVSSQVLKNKPLTLKANVLHNQ